MSADVACLSRTKKHWVTPFQAQGELRDLPNLPGNSGGLGVADGLFWFGGWVFVYPL